MGSISSFHESARSIFLLPCLLFFIVGSVFSQPIIKGKITGRDGIALPGATIKINATNIFTIADSSGRFTLRANPGDAIQVSFVGYNDRQLVLVNETDLNISLTETLVT
jgi:hypothetical protein